MSGSATLGGKLVDRLEVVDVMIIDTAPEKPAEAEPSSFDDPKQPTANDCPMR